MLLEAGPIGAEEGAFIPAAELGVHSRNEIHPRRSLGREPGGGSVVQGAARDCAIHILIVNEREHLIRRGGPPSEVVSLRSGPGGAVRIDQEIPESGSPEAVGPDAVRIVVDLGQSERAGDEAAGDLQVQLVAEIGAQIGPQVHPPEVVGLHLLLGYFAQTAGGQDPLLEDSGIWSTPSSRSHSLEMK